MSDGMRRAGLPVLAAVLVAAVVWVELAHGGGSYEPLKPADACTERVVTSRLDGIEALSERLVLLGVQDAACRLGVGREQLALDLAQQPEATDAQVDALRAGLHHAVAQLDDQGTLPAASSLLDQVLGRADLDPFAAALVEHLPDAVVDDIVPTAEVLDRAIDDLDLRLLLQSIDDQDALEGQVQTAVEDAVRAQLQDPTDAQVDALRAGLHDAVPAMVADGSLPPSSDFLDQALDQADLNPFVEGAIRRLPDSVIDKAVPSDAVLDRVVDKLDLRLLLQNVDDQDALDKQVDAAVEDAVRDQLKANITDLF